MKVYLVFTDIGDEDMLQYVCSTYDIAKDRISHLNSKTLEERSYIIEEIVDEH